MQRHRSHAGMASIALDLIVILHIPIENHHRMHRRHRQQQQHRHPLNLLQRQQQRQQQMATAVRQRVNHGFHTTSNYRLKQTPEI